MKNLSMVLLVVLLGIAIFGFFGMHSGMQNHERGCNAATVRGSDCPMKLTPLDFAAFHLDAFRGFSLTTVGENAVSALLLINLFLLGLSLTAVFLLRPIFAWYYYYEHYPFSPPQKQRIDNWLALFENSPANT